MTSTPGHEEAAGHCHNCGAAVSYHYCAVCGQETRLHVPSASEFIHEFVGHYIALEGRLWATLYLLLSKPGFLTAEYIGGRRVRYVQPLRLYLTFSLIFFAVFKLSGTPVLEVDSPAPRAAVSAAAGPVAIADTFELEGLPPQLQAKGSAFLALPPAERQQVFTNVFFAYVPYAMFCLMPLFALYLKLLYLGTGRRYGEHLLFALHANAFAFAILSLVIVFISLKLGPLVLMSGLWLVLYLPAAMHRVYGGARLATGLRWLALAVLHLASMATAIGSAFLFAVLH